MNDSQHQHHEADEDETPWLSFSDAVTALLFVFIATTFWFMFRLEEARNLLEQRIDERTEEVKKLRGADVAASELLQGVGVCLTERRDDGVRVRPVVEEATHTMSLYIEPQASTIVEWFQVCSAEITPDAAAVVSMARDCLASEIPALTNDYTVILTLEGHTDARAPGAGDCRSRFPSNWELSGARAGAALRRLMCVDGSCDAVSVGEAEKLRTLAQDRDRLQLVAAGRADSMPAWRALCAPDWPGAAIDSGLDTSVCGALGALDLSPGERAARVTSLIGASPIAASGAAVSSFDQALVAWANDPRCAGSAGRSGSCDERFRRLRRVDMRVDLRPRTKE